MLKVRVIPTLLFRDPCLVKNKKFDSWRRIGTVLPAVRVYNTRDVDELIFVDIDAFEDKRSIDPIDVQQFSNDCFVPLTVGGGITHIDQITPLLRAGADKVSINSASFDTPQLITQAAKKYGTQCIVASVDAKQDHHKHICWKSSGHINANVEVVDWCRQLEELGAGEILLTSIDQDGTMNGYDLELIDKVSRAVQIPVIASGGAGSYEHMLQAIQAGATAVAAASIFHFTEHTPLEAKKYLASHGIPVRNAHITKDHK